MLLQVSSIAGHRALLTARKSHLGKVVDIELCIRDVLRGFGPKMGPVSIGRFAARLRELAAAHPILEPVAAFSRNIAQGAESPQTLI